MNKIISKAFITAFVNEVYEGYVFTGVFLSTGSELVWRQHTGNIKCMTGQVTWHPPSRHPPPPEYHVTWSTSGRCASRRNAFLFRINLKCRHATHREQVLVKVNGKLFKFSETSFIRLVYT